MLPSMTPEQAVALLGAITALVVAVSALLLQVQKLRSEVNGRLTQLLVEATQAARKDGELAGRDFVHRMYNPPAEPPQKDPRLDT